MIKQCPKCGSPYETAELFGKDRRCRLCCRAKSKKYRKDNPKKVAESNKKSRKANPQSLSKSLRKARLKRFGLTEEDYENLLIGQNGVCAVCKQVDKITLAIDHCHETDIVRGLLCGSCNKAEGLLKSNPDVIRALADYVEYHMEQRRDLCLSGLVE